MQQLDELILFHHVTLAYHNLLVTQNEGSFWVMALQDDWWIGPELLIDIIFIADIFLNFQTGYIKEQVNYRQRPGALSHLWR